MATTLVKHKKLARASRIGASGKSRARGATKSGAKHPKSVVRSATEPTAKEIAEREAVARALFNPVSARAARAAFLKTDVCIVANEW